MIFWIYDQKIFKSQDQQKLYKMGIISLCGASQQGDGDGYEQLGKAIMMQALEEPSNNEGIVQRRPIATLSDYVLLVCEVQHCRLGRVLGL
jgi:hypothetical protein